MNLDFDKEIERIIKEKTETSPKVLNEIHRIREKENEFIVMELRNAGFKVSDLFDLINLKQTEFGYINILLNLLDSEKVTDPIMKDGIIRAITVKKAKGIAEKKLLEYYNSLTTKREKELIGWSIGNWFEHLYSDSYFDQIKKISTDKNNGVSRQMFVMAIGKTKKHKLEAEKLLFDLTFDKEVVLHAISSLGKLKSKESIERLTELANDKNKTIKKEANKALKKITAE
ncbi:HEAT repeat domain-containing protein [Neotamlana laminarinivorans]|uniref:HEAT repeat domain-containing protein n=1 Tax=Neotamlana laminarinivorans TaxID=2883124 RepID=A0A9X1L2Y5_9FLAO|nr:HEAT repeat domain-containing protein [Tamlana laminarinivorans]MCB4800293.1 HEAT repeat domain-containing protein [Tamlana laminarinivorans]